MDERLRVAVRALEEIASMDPFAGPGIAREALEDIKREDRRLERLARKEAGNGVG